MFSGAREKVHWEQMVKKLVLKIWSNISFNYWNFFKNLFFSFKHCKPQNMSAFFSWEPEPFKRQSHKLVKHTQTIRRQFADELFKCAWLWNWRLKG